jgi:amino acid adenylation domain-containing protein
MDELIKTKKLSNYIDYDENFILNKFPHNLFEKAADIYSECDVLVFKDKKIIYKDLNIRANNLAHYLIKMGVKADTLVGLCLDRSINMLIGLLGIWKAGGAYVPLDPTYPMHRLQYMIDDSGLSFFLTQSDIFSDLKFPLKVLNNLKPIFIDDNEFNTNFRDYSSENPISRGLTLSNLAYVIYTSGSTGKPKGVAVEHRSLINLFIGLSKNLPLNDIGKQYRALQSASISFDSSIKQLLHILNGATLHILPNECRLDPEKFVNYIRTCKINCFDVTPSLMKLLLNNMQDGLLANHLVIILIGGEAIDQSLWNTLVKLQNTKCFNVYGPTECTVDTTISLIEGYNSRPNIGHPLPNIECYVLDENRKVVDSGLIGELYIGGAALARGYLHRDDFTAERFLPNHFSDDLEARIYRTGDLVRCLPDKSLEFIGRLDNQVKVRGYRVELEEIESNLIKHEALQDAAVMVKGENLENKYLVAFIVPKNENLLEMWQINELIEDLKVYLRNNIPTYMIPNIFVPLKKIPLSKNGKVDRNSLNNYQINMSQIKHASPSTSQEKILAEIWCSILMLEKVGVDDDFFQLGGHSLAIMQMISKARELLYVELMVQDIFTHPTISSLLALAKNRKIASAPITSLNRGNVNAPSYEELCFYEIAQSSKSILQMVIKLEGFVDTNYLILSITEVVKRHEILRSAYFMQEGKLIKTVLYPNKFKPKIIDLRKLGKSDFEINLKNQIEFDYLQISFPDTLFLSSIFLEDNVNNYLVFTVAHIIFDIWSFDILINEISSIYSRFFSENVQNIEPIHIQYSDYAAWQMENLSGDKLIKSLDYWDKKLSNLPTLLKLPYDNKYEDNNKFLTQFVEINFSKKISEEIVKLCRSNGFTLYLLLLANLTILLSMYSSQKEVLIVCPVTNRYYYELEKLIGCFVNMVILRNKISEKYNFIKTIKEIMHLSIEAYDHQDTPFILIQEMLIKKYGFFPPQAFQVVLDIHPQPITLKLPGLSVSQLSAGEPLFSSDQEGSSPDLVWIIKDSEAQGFNGRLLFNQKKFSRNRAEQIVKDFVSLLELLVSYPFVSLEGLPIKETVGIHK